jgi:hypothetical protein
MSAEVTHVVTITAAWGSLRANCTCGRRWVVAAQRDDRRILEASVAVHGERNRRRSPATKADVAAALMP